MLGSQLCTLQRASAELMYTHSPFEVAASPGLAVGGFPGAQLHIVAAVRCGVSRSGEGKLMPQSNASGKVAVSSIGLRIQVDLLRGQQNRIQSKRVDRWDRLFAQTVGEQIT